MKLTRRDFIRSTAVAAADSLGIFLSLVNVFAGEHHKYEMIDKKGSIYE